MADLRGVGAAGVEVRDRVRDSGGWGRRGRRHRHRDLDPSLTVFLLTDGEPNCEVDFGTITDYPDKWLSQGIETYVFGLPGSSSAADVLDRIAEAGGTEKHMSSDQGDTPDDLQEDIAACVPI